jgi:p-hydroxybenzoate 3-monooxygenase
MAQHESTTVAIIGGGVAGLTTAMLLRRSGVDCVVLERQTRAYVEQRQRAGLVEYRGIRMFHDWGLDEVLGSFPADNSLEIRVDGVTRLLGTDPFSRQNVGQLVPQQALVRNLIGALLADGADLRFEVPDVTIDGADTDHPLVRYTGTGGTVREITCEFVAGCDGDHGISSASAPAAAMTVTSHDFAVSWLAILADAAPPRYPLMAVGERGYAAQYFRGQHASRFYLQVDPGDSTDDWPANRIWDELRFRMHRPDLPTGPITEIEIFPLRAQVREPMSYGRLYLLGDAAHVISPMGAKGMNLALYDAEVFATAVRDYTATGDVEGLRAYSATCLARTWRYQEWSEWFAEMIFGMCPQNADPFRSRLARARFERVLTMPTAERHWSELFTGLDR